MANHSKLSTSLSFQTNKQLFSVTFSGKDKGKIIQGLDHNKTHGHDNISICMLKICGGTIYKSSEMIFSQALTNGLFRFEWKQGNIVPIHGKNDKQNLINYRPVSLLPICAKIFERLIFNKMFRFFLEKNLLHLTNPVLNWVILV